VRAEIKDKQKKYGVLERRVFEAQAKLNNVESAMMHTLDASGRLHSIRPEIADFLPNDESVKSWKAECVALDKRMEELRSEKRAVGNVQLLRVEAVTLNDQINHLLWREQNILNELRRALAQRPVGGSFAPV
jgi:hypothetical protein